MYPYRRISAIAGAALLGLLLAFLIRLPTRVVSVNLLGESWHVVVSGAWLVGFALCIWVYLGNDLVLRAHPATDGRLGYVLTFWPLPGLLVLFGTPFLYTLANPLFWIVGAVLLALLLAAILLGQYQAVASSASRRPASWFLSLAAYALAFGALFFLSQFDFPASWLAVGVICAALSLEILRQRPQDVRRTWGYGALIGLLMAEIAWALSYWALGDLLLVLYLFWPFYLLTSIAHQYLGGQLRRAAVLEYIVLAVFGFGLLWYFTPWQ
jgi:hypothetical protein